MRWVGRCGGAAGARGPSNLQHFLVGAVAEEEGGDALAAEGLGERVEAAVAVVGERARLLDDGDALLHRPQLERQRRRAERLGDDCGERERTGASHASISVPRVAYSFEFQAAVAAPLVAEPSEGQRSADAALQHQLTCA